MKTVKEIKELLDAYEAGTLEYTSSGKPYEACNKDNTELHTILGRIVSGSIKQFRIIDWKQKYIDAFKAGKLELKYKDKEDVWRKPNITPDNIELLLSYNEYEFRIVDEYTPFEDALNLGKTIEVFDEICNDIEIWKRYITEVHGGLRGIKLSDLRIKEETENWKQKYIDAFKAGKLELKYIGKWMPAEEYCACDRLEYNLDYCKERNNINYLWRIVDEYTKFRDAEKAGKLIRAGQDEVTGIKWYDKKIDEPFVKYWHYKIIDNPYQKFIDAEKDPLKVVQVYSDKWITPSWGLYYTDKPDCYRIMEYIHFDKSDLKNLYKKDVIHNSGIVCPLDIDIVANKILTDDGMMDLKDAFVNLRFYDPTKNYFEDMPIFGKLIEIKE